MAHHCDPQPAAASVASARRKRRRELKRNRWQRLPRIRGFVASWFPRNSLLSPGVSGPTPRISRMNAVCNVSGLLRTDTKIIPVKASEQPYILLSVNRRLRLLATQSRLNCSAAYLSGDRYLPTFVVVWNADCRRCDYRAVFARGRRRYRRTRPCPTISNGRRRVDRARSVREPGCAHFARVLPQTCRLC